ncbi:MAG: hypothetical protein ACM3SQ_14505 [Betaproteobacteria bacterium]
MDTPAVELTPDREHAELLMLYEQAVQDIERAKQWGWQLTYSAILAQFGLLALARTYQTQAAFWVEPAFAGLMALIGCAATVFIGDASTSVNRFRERLRRCRARLLTISLELLGEIPPKPSWPSVLVVWVSTVVTVALVVLA